MKQIKQILWSIGTMIVLTCLAPIFYIQTVRQTMNEALQENILAWEQENLQPYAKAHPWRRQIIACLVFSKAMIQMPFYLPRQVWLSYQDLRLSRALAEIPATQQEAEAFLLSIEKKYCRQGEHVTL